MKIAVIGSRDIMPNIEKIIRDIQKITDEKPIIISGGAKGTDQQAKIAAKKMEWEYIEYRPNYELYGTPAPIITNSHNPKANNRVPNKYQQHPITMSQSEYIKLSRRGRTALYKSADRFNLYEIIFKIISS